MMEARDLLSDTKAESEVRFVCAGTVESSEAFEDRFLLIIWDTRSVVADSDTETVAVREASGQRHICGGFSGLRRHGQ